ncbi:meiosis regulator and mRNA stability factor 1-like [Macrosteles quadrilineatus]|uniref:meiosis regulator and mRNA stability factor 1-like n=1 Tax=Macrosteles quadrilineatus TaxID=74068 RepID=UPI0023E2025C|nr:meiosis regulator and mRNA stability factor 1-like [Macrosteles quadrilineatus]
MIPIIGGQRNISSGLHWASPPPSNTVPILGFFGLNSQPQPVTFINNQENIPFPVPPALWNQNWNIHPRPSLVQTQCTVGRPILGRRSEPNCQPDLRSSFCDSLKSANTSTDSVNSNGEEMDRGVKRARPHSPMDNMVQNNNHTSHKGSKGFRRTPSPYSMLGVNTSIPPPPIVNLTRRVESEYCFNPIPQPTCNPVELHVTNLDQSIDLREMKKLLMAAFREHVMVLHVSVFVQSDGTLAASIKVPSVQDAQYAISQLHRRKVGFKRIMIAYAHSSSPQNSHYVKNQIAALLLEVPEHKMPLFTFRELFASRYLTSVGVSDLYRMRDVCVIIEENNGRTITLNPEYRNTPSPALSTDTVSGVDLPFCLRHSQHRGAVDKGWAEQEQPSLANVRVRLAELSQHLASLIQSHDNYLPLASLMDCYAAQFEPLVVDEQSVPLEHLVTCISNVELIHSGSNKHLRLCRPKPPLDSKNEDSITICVSPSLVNHVTLFARELVDLLKMQPHCQLLFNRFIPAYHHHFGRQCRVADYGFTKLIDLFETLPHVVQVMGEGNKRVVTLSYRAQIRRFTSDLLRVLKSQPSKQVLVSELAVLFERTLNRPFDPVDYGLCYLEDLLTQLSANIVILSGRGSEATIAIPKREQTPEEIERTKQFALQVVELLSHTPQCSMEFAKFIPAYHHHYGTQCRVADFGFTKLIELFEAIPEVVKVEEEGEGVRKVSLTQPEKIKVLANQMSELVLPRYPPGLAVENAHSAYLWQFGYALKPSAYGCHDLMEVLSKLPTIQISTDNETAFITPVDQSKARTLRLRVLRILWEHGANRMSLPDFEHAFLKHYQQPFELHIVESDLEGVVEVVDNSVQLTPLELFARDVYELLRSSDGRLALSSFESAFRRNFGALPSPAKLGYSSTLTLLQAIGHVVQITSRGQGKLLSLNVELAAAGIALPPGMVRNPNFNNLDPCKHFDFPDSRFVSQSAPKGVHTKANGNKPRQDSPWNMLWNGKNLTTNNNGMHSDCYDQPTVIHLPEPRTPPSKEECMALLSPAKFLLPANNAFYFLPSAPDPSELPKPFNLTQVKNAAGFMEKQEDSDDNDQ